MLSLIHIYGVTAKDIILAIIAQNGVGGGTGYVFEYTGSAIRALNMEERMTICNMSIEGGARAGMIAPDETTFSYIAGRPFAPKAEAWEQALAAWRSLPTDEGAQYDAQITLDANQLTPMISSVSYTHLDVYKRQGHSCQATCIDRNGLW